MEYVRTLQLRELTAGPLRPEHNDAWHRMILRDRHARSVEPMWHRTVGWLPNRIGLFANGELVGGVMIVTRRMPCLPWRIARVNSLMVGP